MVNKLANTEPLTAAIKESKRPTKRYFNQRPETREKTYWRLNEVIDSQLAYLQTVDFPATYFVSRGTQLEIRQKSLENYMQNKSLNIREVKEQLIARAKLAEYKEKI
jgi:hypothetical protein